MKIKKEKGGINEESDNKRTTRLTSDKEDLTRIGVAMFMSGYLSTQITHKIK